MLIYIYSLIESNSRHTQNTNTHTQQIKTVLPSTQEGAALVVPATCPGKQEHLTVWERSSILFLLQQRWAAMTSQVPALTCTEEKQQGHRVY